jgi:hypothetical protein
MVTGKLLGFFGFKLSGMYYVKSFGLLNGRYSDVTIWRLIVQPHYLFLVAARSLLEQQSSTYPPSKLVVPVLKYIINS